jgi:hypothetical protein
VPAKEHGQVGGKMTENLTVLPVAPDKTPATVKIVATGLPLQNLKPMTHHRGSSENSTKTPR